ncbi:SDR family oxidoreductase [Paractinoplanes brasiliensis]|uniref:Uncharacterized protein n=1 Tax=Paractinoplanes brasiliensis TaxID=52695 RepID=A0A4R6K1Z7_9ACTN|nr:SDR family oxidoreductase [Actinoplanes brasiliensis]TDO41656.1 hypothetical protein C8E87_5392 [Actinoplanes brasiliensis]
MLIDELGSARDDLVAALGASDASRFITGEHITVSGGHTTG